MGGLGDKTVVHVGANNHTVLVFADGSVQAWGPNSTMPDLGNTRVVAGFAGTEHTVLVMEDGSVKACGRNSSDQCTIPDLNGKKACVVAQVEPFVVVVDLACAN